MNPAESKRWSEQKAAKVATSPPQANGHFFNFRRTSMDQAMAAKSAWRRETPAQQQAAADAIKQRRDSTGSSGSAKS